MAPQVIFGDVQEFPDLDGLRSVLKKNGIKRMDSAARYDECKSEGRLGAAKFGDDFAIDTKLMFNNFDTGDAEPEKVETGSANSVKALGVKQINVYYLHGPDEVTPIAEQARAMDKAYKAGRFKYLGVSNFDVPMMQEWFDIAEKEGLVKPAAYEGHYNLLSRGLEQDVFPFLRKHNMVFNAYSPIGGGFLLGNFTPDGHKAGNRFGEGAIGMVYKIWYDKPELHEAVKKIRAVSDRTGISMADLVVRWLFYHSALGDADGVIIGASKFSTIDKNCEQVKKGPLDDSVAKELTEIGDAVPQKVKEGIYNFDFFRQMGKVPSKQ